MTFVHNTYIYTQRRITQIYTRNQPDLRDEVETHDLIPKKDIKDKDIHKAQTIHDVYTDVPSIITNHPRDSSRYVPCRLA